MAYIDTTDLQAYFQPPYLEELTEASNVTQFTTILAKVQEQVAGYIRHWYDCDVEFAKTGTDRNAFLVGIFCDLITFELLKAGTARNVTNVSIDARDRAIESLKDIQTGKIMIDIEKYTFEDEEEEAAFEGQEANYGQMDIDDNYGTF